MLKRITTTLLFAITAALAAGNPEGVPQEAKETAPGVYRLVDKDGKAWVYRKTPFGISKRAEGETTAAPDAERSRMTPFGETKAKAVEAVERTGTSGAPAGTAVKTKVTEQGDTLHFDRPTPFGSYKWSKKKSELTADEQRVWDEHRATSGAETKAK